MTSDTFPNRWAPTHTDRLQLYSMPTPNGQKIGIALEELGVPYDAHRIDIMAGDQHHPEFLKINPNAKIPALLDPDGPDGKPMALMESGAILMYLAEKTGKLLPTAASDRWRAVQWLFFQMASVGPMFGQFGHFYKYAKGKTDDYGEERYAKEANRLLGVLDQHLAHNEYLAGDSYSIADIATAPWVKALDFYEGKERVGYASFGHVDRWVEVCWARPAVQRGITVCAATVQR